MAACRWKSLLQSLDLRPVGQRTRRQWSGTVDHGFEKAKRRSEL